MMAQPPEPGPPDEPEPPIRTAGVTPAPGVVPLVAWPKLDTDSACMPESCMVNASPSGTRRRMVPSQLSLKK